MDEKKVLRFDLDNESIQIKNALNKDFLPIKISAVSSALPNNNGSNFNKESQILSLPTWDNKPIVGFFGNSPTEKLMGKEEDFKSHYGGEITHDEELDEYYYDYSKSSDEKILGFTVPGSAKVVYHEDDGLWWTEVDAKLWVKYNYKEVKNLLKSKKKTVSVEVEIFASHEDENGVEIFEDYSLMGICILGSINGQKVPPGVSNAHLTVSNFSKTENFQKQMKVLSFAYNSQFDNTKNASSSISSSSNLKQKSNNNSKSFSKDSDDTIYHTNDPKNPENEDWEEITFDDDSNSDNKSKEKDGKEKMSQMNFSLSYSTRRQILDNALQEAINNYYSTDNNYGYISDFDDEYAYFYLDTQDECGDFCAPYSLVMKINTEEVEDCTIDLSRKEKVIREWKRYVKDDKNSETEKTDMKKDEVNMAQDSEKDKDTKKMADDRGTEATKSGTDDRGHPASKSGDDRGTPHSPATYEDDKDVDKKEDEACGDKQDEAKDEKECKMADDSCDCGNDGKDSKKEDEACDDTKKEDEAKEVTEVGSISGGGDKEVTEVKSRSANACDCDDGKDDSKKEDEACSDTDKECKMAKDTDKDTEKECNYEAKFAQLSADYVAMQKENETLKAVNAKFEADIAELMKKVENFEVESKNRHNNDMYTFGFNMIEAESDLDENCRKNMSAELKTECEAGKFASEDEVKKFTVTKIAMAYYEARTNGTKTQNKVDNSSVDKNNEKKDFVQNINKNSSTSGTGATGMSALAKARQALESLDSDEEC